MNLDKYPVMPFAITSIISGFIVPQNAIQYSIAYLIALMILDLITGILASYNERKENLKVDKCRSSNFIINNFLYVLNTGFFLRFRNFLFNLDNVVTSKKLKLSGVKLLLYFSTILVTYFFEQIFFIKPFKLVFSDLNFSLTIAVVLFWSAVEWYSIFFENFKRMGIDIKLIIFKMVRNLLQIKTEITKLSK